MIEVKLNIERRKLLVIFGLYASDEGRVEENENFYDKLQDILNNNIKND
jgi:hypothetical protein